MELVELPTPTPADGEVLVNISRTGVNYADTHATRDDYLAKQKLPLVPGAELVGVTEDGIRVAAVVPSGAYAEVRREMKIRYPRHPWPEDPWSAPATHKTKPRGT